MSLECTPATMAQVCFWGPLAQVSAGETLLLAFEEDPNDLKSYLELKDLSTKDFTAIEEKGTRPGARPADKLLAAAALIFKAETSNDQALLLKAKKLLESIHVCCFPKTRSFLEGKLYFYLGDWDKAEGAFLECQGKKTGLYLTGYYLMIMDLVQGGYMAAQEHLASFPPAGKEQQFKQLFPDVVIAQVRVLLGLGEQVFQDFTSQAEALLAADHHVDKSSIDFQILQAQLWIGRQYFVRGRDSLIEISQKNPDNPYVFYVLGKFFQGMAENDKALDYYTKAVEAAGRCNNAVLKKYGDMASGKIREVLGIQEKVRPLLRVK